MYSKVSRPEASLLLFEFLMRVSHRFQHGELPKIINGACNHTSLRRRGLGLVFYDCPSGNGPRARI